jgi:hypothetical protein
MLAYVETVQSKEKEIGCDVLTHQKWCAASSLTPPNTFFRPSFCYAGVERITSMEFCPRSHPDLRAPLHGERILPNTHSKNVVKVPLYRNRKKVMPKSRTASSMRVPILFCLKKFHYVLLSRDLRLGSRDDDKRVRPCPPTRRSGAQRRQNGVLQPPRMYPPSVFIAHSMQSGAVLSVDCGCGWPSHNSYIFCV